MTTNVSISGNHDVEVSATYKHENGVIETITWEIPKEVLPQTRHVHSIGVLTVREKSCE